MPVGFEVDILKAMPKAMGVKLELVSTGYDGIIPALMTDKFDMIGSGMTLTQERNLLLNFSDPFIVVGQTLLIRKELVNLSREFAGIARCRCSLAPMWQRSSAPACSRLPVSRSGKSLRHPWPSRARGG
ncbi:putative binding protein component of ABC transporter [Pseudomonas fluorescens]|uniref:Putative binding protein component of ABC transporter n=1 Tax=Pseudomonas fluorescens TaxID=294 RepID=A0A3S4PAE8_PSEFL|nr:putative binding protein component of ABC transporter [Pseudomonas fluorescens]